MSGLLGGGSSSVLDEGTSAGNAGSFNFVGAGVTATVSGSTVTVTIPGITTGFGASASTRVVFADGSGNLTTSANFTYTSSYLAIGSAVTLVGGIAASDNLTINSTSHATKGFVYVGTDGSYLRVGNNASQGPNVSAGQNGPGNPQGIFRQSRTDTAGAGGAGFVAVWDIESDIAPSANSTALFLGTYTSLVKSNAFNVGALYGNYNFVYVTGATAGVDREISGYVADIAIRAAISGVDPSIVGFYSLIEANASASGILDVWHFYAQDSIGSSTRTTGTQYGLYCTDMTSGHLANYAIYTNAGLVRFGDSVTVITGKNLLVGGATAESGSTNTVAVASGTAPDNGVADEVILYSSDNAAGHTIPSFYCEGTQVIATGQADSVSSVRVKMRINGTVVTLLAV